MIPHIPRQRQHHTSAKRPFSDLVKYIEENQERSLSNDKSPLAEMRDLLDYATNPIDQLTHGEKCIAIRTHLVESIETAATEMNAVAKENRRCKYPAFHFILSWPESERPSNETVFDAAEHAIKKLGLGQHQYVIAIHGNTDNRHCHIAVNRVHPATFKSALIEWARTTLHMAARESEIKHNWFNDNGIYVVRIDEHGRKEIVFNNDHDDYRDDLEEGGAKPADLEALLPTWHDPDSLEAWLKGPVSRALKRALPHLQSWHGLHAWLDRLDIALKDSGGGGMKLVVTSYETGEILDLAASKGLRALKRADLEKRWGAYTPIIESPCIVPDTSHLTPHQLAQGAQRVIDRNGDFRSPHDHILNLEQHRQRLAAEKSRGLHDLSARHLDARRPGREMLVSPDVHVRLDQHEAGQYQDLRRPGTGSGGSGGVAPTRPRDPALREQRRLERAAARADLRARFAAYRRFIRSGDSEFVAARSQLRADRRAALANTNKQAKIETREAQGRLRDDFVGFVEASRRIANATVRDKLAIEIRYKQQLQELRALRPPILGWREWLHEQANLGDQAAVSALRGIVYQARRDAKRDGKPADDFDEARAKTDADYREQQYKKNIARLVAEEQQEIAIRAARSDAMRAHELDALLVRYAGIQWRVTDNGNIEYSDRAGGHLFTDRGNRLTFDRARVGDDEIRLALLHAREKFGGAITLTGKDRIFTERMARLADDLGITVLNPDMAAVIAKHRSERAISASPMPTPQITAQTPQEPSTGLATPSAVPQPQTTAPETLPIAAAPAPASLDSEQQLRAKVLAIDPYATFVPLVPSERYTGPVMAEQDGSDQQGGLFAQHIGRSRYVIHAGKAPARGPATAVDVRYRDGQAHMRVIAPSRAKGKNRTK